MLDGEGGAAREPWTRLAALRYENRSTLDPSVPLPPDPSWQDRPHDLLTGIWQWQPPAGSRFQLAVPRGEPVDTLLWQADTPDGNPKWKILISGDRTEWFGPLVEDAWWRSPWLLALLALGVLCFLFWAHRRKL